jgi:biopolymer transport protein ExbD
MTDLIQKPGQGDSGATEHELALGEQIEVRRKKPKRRHAEADDLNINSMMDIMTILLVFLLVSVTSDPLAIKENTILKASRSRSNFPAVYTIPLTVNKKEILVDGKRALPVACKFNGRPCTEEDYERPTSTYSIDPVNKEHGKRESMLIIPLKESLEKSVKALKDQNMEMPEEVRKKYLANQGVATIICDVDIPYRMIAEVVYTVAMAELHDIRFAVIYSGGGG